MSEQLFGPSFEELSDAEQHFIDYVDAHLPDFESDETVTRDADYRVDNSYPLSPDFIRFGAWLDDDGYEFPIQRRSIEFFYVGPGHLTLTLFSIFHSVDRHFEMTTDAGYAIQVSESEMHGFVDTTLEGLHNMENSGLMTPM